MNNRLPPQGTKSSATVVDAAGKVDRDAITRKEHEAEQKRFNGRAGGLNIPGGVPGIVQSEESQPQLKRRDEGTQGTSSPRTNSSSRSPYCKRESAKAVVRESALKDVRSLLFGDKTTAEKDNVGSFWSNVGLKAGKAHVVRGGSNALKHDAVPELVREDERRTSDAQQHTTTRISKVPQSARYKGAIGLIPDAPQKDIVVSHDEPTAPGMSFAAKPHLVMRADNRLSSLEEGETLKAKGSMLSKKSQERLKKVGSGAAEEAPQDKNAKLEVCSIEEPPLSPPHGYRHTDAESGENQNSVFESCQELETDSTEDPPVLPSTLGGCVGDSVPGAFAIPGPDAAMHENLRSDPERRGEDVEESEEARAFPVEAYTVKDTTFDLTRLEVENEALRKQMQEFKEAPVASLVRKNKICRKYRKVAAVILLALAAVLSGILVGVLRGAPPTDTGPTNATSTPSDDKEPPTDTGPTNATSTPSDDKESATNSGPIVTLSPEDLKYCFSTKLLPADGTFDDFFGASIALSGSTAIIGAPYDSDNGFESGSAYVFVRSDTMSWQQEAKLLAPGGAAEDWFGYSVDIDGKIAVAGADGDDTIGEESGAAYVFFREGSKWNLTDKLLPDDAEADDYFGSDVAISGDTILVGAQYANANGKDSGTAYIFSLKQDGSWEQEAKLLAEDGTRFDRFGCSVSIDGNTVVIGAKGKKTKQGFAYIFTRTGTLRGPKWIQSANLTANDGAERDEFGTSVAISGDTVIIGSDYHEHNGEKSGAAYVYVRSGAAWELQAELLPRDAQFEDSFGYSVALDGDVAVIGSWMDDANGSDSGSVYVFVRTGDTWREIEKLVANDGAAEDYLGSAVAIDSTTILVGAEEYDGAEMDSGSAYAIYLC